MPKLGMEPIRRQALVDATIAEVGEAGSLDVTVSRIARRAGVSSALAHHYFGSKDQLFLAAMRSVLTEYGAEVRTALQGAKDPRARLEAVVTANFSADSFRNEVIAAWLNFYVLAQSNDGAQRLLRVYQRRLQSNLCHALRPLVGDRADAPATMIAALIDGLYIRHALRGQRPDGQAAAAQVLSCIDAITEGETA